jgi:hypothetical protein
MADTLEIAKRPAGDGMPQGQTTSLGIRDDQVKVDENVAVEAAFDDNAAASIAWDDYQKAIAFVDENSWLQEWQYIDYLYQSPNFDQDTRTTGRAARISRFNVAKNARVMSSQTRRAVFGDDKWFMLDPRGKMAGRPDAEQFMNAWTELLLVLCDRADLEYQMRLFIECLTLQGTGIAVPGWEERDVVHTWRQPIAPPEQITMPTGGTKTIHTFKSDNWETKKETVTESWPFIEYRRLGTTLYSEKWRHPGRPDLSGWPRIDVDYVDFQQLRQMRKLDCYHTEDKNGKLQPTIPSDEDLKNFFLTNPLGDAQVGSQAAQMNVDSGVVKARGEQVQSSANAFKKPLMKIAYWTEQRVIELLVYLGRKLTIRNEEHGLDIHAAGYSAAWYTIDNSGYGFGTGRVNAGDQRMSQGVLNEVLKMIAFPMNAPLLYDTSSGNAPVQNILAGLGTMLGIDAGKTGDVRKSVGFMEMPQVPPEAWRVYELAVQGGEQAVGADKAMMQGQLPGAGSSIGRTATGASRLAEKADDSIADPVQMIEWVLEKFLQFLWKGVREVMPIKEIRDLLSEKYGAKILETLDAKEFMDARFEIKILCGKKLAAKAAIAQLIPFLLQILAQPNIEQYLQQIGMRVNYAAIANLFMRMSELAAREDIFVPMTDQQRQMAQQMNPAFAKMQAEMAKEKQKGQDRLADTELRGKQELTRTITEKALDHVEGAVPLELAEARLARNTDMATLQNGAVSGLDE